jgi:uncharacterized protein
MQSILVSAEQNNIAAYCDRWRVQELSLFGSVLTDNFTSDSDIDVLVTFVPSAKWSLLDLVQAERELSGVLGKPVDLVERSVIEQSANWIRRRSILANTKTIYAR